MTLTRDQILRGKNTEFDAYKIRGKKGAANSPWSKGPLVKTKRAAKIFEANKRP